MNVDWIKIGAIIAFAVGIVLGALAAHHHIYQQGYAAGAAAVQAKFDAALHDAEQKRLADVQAAKLEGDRRVKAQTESTNEAVLQLNTALADRDSAVRAAGRLQERVTELVRALRAAAHPAPVGSGAGEQSGDPLDVLVNVLQRTGDAAGQLSDFADKLKVAGLKCERDYDALTPAR